MAALPLLAATGASLAVWFLLRAAFGRQLDRARPLRQRQAPGPSVPPSPNGAHRAIFVATVLGLLVGLAGLGWWQTIAFALIAQRGAVLGKQLAASREQAELAAELPIVWLLFAACQQAGLSLRQSVHVLADRLGGRAGRCLQQVHSALAAGHGLLQAGRTAGTDTEFARGWELLVRAEAVGSPVGPLLRRLAAQAAAEQRWQRQAALARLPLWLTVVSVCCFMPGVLVVTVLPQVLGFIAQMS